MVEVTNEMKDLAKAAATAYVSGLREQNSKQAVDYFLESYDYALKKIWLRTHKENAMKDITGGAIIEDEN